MRRVKYYSRYDLSAGWYLEETSNLILNFKKSTNKDINEVLELYNCVQFISNDVFSVKWSEDHIAQLEEKSKEIYGYIARYFNTINNENFHDTIKNIENIYRDDFLELFSRFNLMNEIVENEMRLALELGYFTINGVCLHKKIVESYADTIRELIINNPTNIELILDNYVVANRRLDQKKLYFPEVLTLEDIHMLTEWYIKCKKANPNYLELIINNHNTNQFSVTDELRWRAKIQLDEFHDTFFQENKGINFTYILKLKSNVDKLVDYKINETEYTIIIDKDYLNDTLDSPSILNNFIWLFGFVDMNVRMTFVSKESSNSSLIDTIFNLSSIRDYPSNTKFKANEQFGHLFMHMYYSFLRSKDIRLENVIQWFFEEYLEIEFKISDFRFLAPSKESSFREKCRDLLAEFEYLLLQYKSFIKYGFINHELLELSSSGISFKDVPSLIQNKYVYPTELLNTIFYLLFSDQTNLGYLGESEKSKSTFYELISNETVSYNEFEQHQQSSLDYLLETKYIIQNGNGNIDWFNISKIKILKSLYDNEVITFDRFPQQLQEEILVMKDKNEVIFESSLLTRQEQDLLDYYLNNSKFQNGPQIRNKYSHGREGNKDEKVNYNNYLTILRLVISVIIKINDDLCLNAKIINTSK